MEHSWSRAAAGPRKGTSELQGRLDVFPHPYRTHLSGWKPASPAPSPPSSMLGECCFFFFLAAASGPEEFAAESRLLHRPEGVERRKGSRDLVPSSPQPDLGCFSCVSQSVSP